MNDGCISSCGSAEFTIHFHALPGRRISYLTFSLDSFEAKKHMNPSISQKVLPDEKKRLSGIFSGFTETDHV